MLINVFIYGQDFKTVNINAFGVREGKYYFFLCAHC